MEHFISHLSEILCALGTIIAAYFAYNQHEKNAKTDLKIEKWKAEQEERSAKRSDNIAKIYGALWQVLHDLNADRVYIVQPHPLTNSLFLSISLEVKRNGVSAMKPCIQKLPMSDIAAFSAELSQRDFILYGNIEQDVKDKRAKAILSTNGSHAAVIRRLTDEEHDWIGSLFCEFTHSEHELNPTRLREVLLTAAERIEFILPEYKNN